LTSANLATQVTPERLGRLADLVADGTLMRPELETFSFEGARRALEKVATRQVRSKLVIRVRS
jgi:hypothetical protein